MAAKMIRHLQAGNDMVHTTHKQENYYETTRIRRLP